MVQSTQQKIPSKDGGAFMAYVTLPEKLPAPTVIMIQEIFGVNAEMRRKCEAMAEKGYIAVAPDLFWRMEPGVELTDKTEAEWAKAYDFYKRFDVDNGVEDLRATLHAFKGHAHSTGRVGCVGFCLGGKLAYLLAARSHCDAAVGYYGVGLDALLDAAGGIEKPLLLHIAEEDKFTPKPAQEKIRAGLAGHAHITIHSYPGVEHAFAREGGEHFDQRAATLANARTDAFLARTLKGAG